MSIIKIKSKNLFVSEKNVRKDLTSLNDENTTIEDLADDIKQNGLINAISVRQTVSGKYEIYAGQRRFHAMKLLKWDLIPCVINNLPDDKVEIVSLSENLHRSNMTMNDKMDAINRLYKLGKTIYEITKLTSLSTSTVKKYIKLQNNLCPDLIEKLDDKDGSITVEFAEKVALYEKDKQKIIFDKTSMLSNKHKIEFVSKHKGALKDTANNSISNLVDKYNIDRLSTYKVEERRFNILMNSKKEKIEIPSEYIDEIYNIVTDKIKEKLKNTKENEEKVKKEKEEYFKNFTKNLNPKIIKYYSEYKGNNLTSIIKPISNKIFYDYIVNQYFNNKLNNESKKSIDIDNKILKSIHSINPSICGIFFDYLSRKIICSISNTRFEDDRAELMTNISLIKLIKISGCKSYSRKKCLVNMKKRVSLKTLQDVLDIFIVSLSHEEFFSRTIHLNNASSIIKILTDEFPAFLEFIKKYTEFYKSLINTYASNKKSILLNPNIGDAIVKADCDFVCGKMLIDFKCTAKKYAIYETLQLLSYASLLLMNNNYEIDYVSIINPIMCVQEIRLIKGNNEELKKVYDFIHGKY